MSATSVTSTPGLLDFTGMPDIGGTGQILVIQNLGPGDVWVDYTNTVSSSNGVKISSGMVWEIAAYQPSRPLYLVSSGGNADVRYLVVG